MFPNSILKKEIFEKTHQEAVDIVNSEVSQANYDAFRPCLRVSSGSSVSKDSYSYDPKTTNKLNSNSTLMFPNSILKKEIFREDTSGSSRYR